MSDEPPVNAVTRSFLMHFTALMDAAAQRDGRSGELLLTPGQRTALSDTLRRWTESLLAAAPTASDSSGSGKSIIRRGSFIGEDSFLSGDMGDRWFAHPHLALIPAPWANPRGAHSPAAFAPNQRGDSEAEARLRLLGDLQRLCSEPSAEAFAEALSRALRGGGGEAQDTEIARWDFARVVEDLAPSAQPPASVLGDVLFSEWCRAAVGDDSFASTHAPLRLVESDLDEFRRTGGSGDTDNDTRQGATVGTIAGLACAHPMQAEDTAETLDTPDEALQAFVQRNTAAFRVPLASVVLNVYRVGLDGRVQLARQEAQYRGGDMEWHTVGDSKRHRRLLESNKRES